MARRNLWSTHARSSDAGGTRVIDRLAADLRRSFPEASGFSGRNLKYMRSMAEAYPDASFVQQVVAQAAEELELERELSGESETEAP